MIRGVIHLCNQIFDVSKIFLLLSVICFAPHVLFREKKKVVVPSFNVPRGQDLRLGIENVTAEYLASISPRVMQPRIALISHAPMHEYPVYLDVLQRKNIAIAKVLYPYYAMHIADSGSKECGIIDGPVPGYSIKKEGIDEAILQDVTLLLVDIQDIGIGYASCVNLLFQALSAAVVHNIPIVVLDRPNMLGNKIEGSLVSSPELCGCVPLRHGMTVGELAYYYNTHILDDAAHLHVVPMHNYRREAIKNGVYVPTLSRISSVKAAWSFSICGVLADVSPIDVGIDTEHAYEYIALPKSVGLSEQRWYQLQIMLKHLGVESVLCSYYSKQKQESCRGLRLHIQDMQVVDSFNVLLRVLDFFKHSGVILGFTDAFDQAVGTPIVREYLRGKIDKHVLVQAINDGLEQFYRKAFGSFMYHPLPRVVLM